MPHLPGAMEEAQRRFEALQSLPTIEAPQRLIQDTLNRIEQYDRVDRRLWRWGTRGTLAATAAAVLIIGSLHIYYASLQASPYDLQVLGQRELSAGSAAALRVRLTNRTVGAAMVGVPVAVELQSEGGARTVRLAQFTTNREGTADVGFRLPEWNDGQYELRVRADVPAVRKRSPAQSNSSGRGSSC